MAVSESWLPHDGDTLAITVKPEGAIYQVGITRSGAVQQAVPVSRA
jgi:hypothetical protein